MSKVHVPGRTPPPPPPPWYLRVLLRCRVCGCEYQLEQTDLDTRDATVRQTRSLHGPAIIQSRCPTCRNEQKDSYLNDNARSVAIRSAEERIAWVEEQHRSPDDSPERRPHALAAEPGGEGGG